MTRAGKIRVGVLLTVLALVAFDAWLTRVRTTSWERPLWAFVYPIVADGRDTTRDYVRGLKRDHFRELESFLARESRRHGVKLDAPLHVELGRELGELPPLPPKNGGIAGTAWWSLKLRWWARGVSRAQPPPRGDIRVFVLYYDPDTTPQVAHSLGLQKGLVGIVHAYAHRRMTATNNVVIAHELLHTLGATDKYDPATGQPRYPHGYADPSRQPRYPQAQAELMAGRIAQAPGRAEMPESLASVMIGPLTSREIGWTRR
jgi:hypothetical protein